MIRLTLATLLLVSSVFASNCGDNSNTKNLCQIIEKATACLDGLESCDPQSSKMGEAFSLSVYYIGKIEALADVMVPKHFSKGTVENKLADLASKIEKRGRVWGGITDDPDFRFVKAKGNQILSDSAKNIQGILKR